MLQADGQRGSRRRHRRRGSRIAVLVPCYNEEAAIGKVVADFRAALPDAAIYVYDNNSTDRTVEAAAAAGAMVRREPHQGKGRVVRRMFTDVDADIYVLVDGDATYDAPSAPAMIEQAGARPARHGRGGAGRPRGGGLPARPSRRQPAAHRLRRPRVRRVVHRHAVGLPGVHPPLREIVSGAVGRLRDRDRAHRPRARARTAGRRGAHAVLFAAARARPPSSRPGATAFASCAPSCKLYRAERPLPFFGALGVSLGDRRRSGSRSRSSSPIMQEGWCRGCRPRCCPPG